MRATSLDDVIKPRKFTSQQTIDFLRAKLCDTDILLYGDTKKHSIIAHQGSKKVFELRLPLPFPSIKEHQPLEDYLAGLDTNFPSYILLLIQAGYAAIGHFQDGEFLNHKALSAYMVRKRQGKNELTYSAKSGGGRSKGSHLRYQNAIHFFEEINTYLGNWNTGHPPHRILFSCPVAMWGYLFNSKVKSLFGKDDPRLQKIPLDVRVPNYKELTRINRIISCGYLNTFEPDTLKKLFPNL